MTWRDRLRHPSPRAIRVAGWLVFLLYAYPGYLTHTSIIQLLGARAGSYSDWYPTMLTELWRIVEVILAGPAGMLALQSLLLLEGSYHLLRRAMGARGAALGACGVLLFPPILATMAVVCPEAQLAGWLAAGAAALGSERRGVRFAGLGLLVVATGMQGGAALATLPIVVLGWPWQQGRAAWQRAAAALGAWAILTAGAMGIDHALPDEHTGRPEVALAMDDIVGTIAAAGPLDDAALRRELAGVSLAATDHLRGRSACSSRPPMKARATRSPPRAAPSRSIIRAPTSPTGCTGSCASSGCTARTAGSR